MNKGVGVQLRLLAQIVAGLLVTACLGAANASAVSTVNSLADDGDEVLDGTCQTIRDGECTLRAAIEEANAAGPDVIDAFELTGTIALQSELPSLTSMTITGSEDLEISRDSADAFRILTVLPNQQVSVANFKLSNGFVTGTTAAGGGILNEGTLELNDVRVIGNRIRSSRINGSAVAKGAGIENLGTLTLNATLVIFNRAVTEVGANDGSTYSSVARGGGIFNHAGAQLSGDGIVNSNTVDALADSISGTVVTVRGEGGGIANEGDATFGGLLYGNRALAWNNGNGGGSSAGGAIFNAAGGDFQLGGAEVTEVSGNKAIGAVSTDANTPAGGGLFNAGSADVELTRFLENSVEATNGTQSASGGGIANTGNAAFELVTVARNQVTNTQSGGGGGNPVVGGLNGGGGIYQSGAAAFTSATIAHNTASSAGVTPSGGSNLLAVAGSTTLRNSIVSNPLGTGGNCAGTPVSLGYNVEDDAGHLCHFTHSTDITGDPLLQLLAGEGAIYTLADGSPAIDTGSSFGETTDQLGKSRPVDIEAVPNTPCGDAADIGAVEVQPTDGWHPGVAPDCTPPMTGAPLVAAPISTASGQRATALRKCKTKKGKARKKCKKKAKKLPV